ncbi:hypothetical protein RF11_15008 [Thelohanellus kitauei]|uniref:Uncharacterized protein n=1 Tax=Thelohanellus kitauei TaxID=669202 RepID=A0A0C2MHF9_THEKT|nr:hypothetical protein RF11_15008 [Thelohanellus kitauei]
MLWTFFPIMFIVVDEKNGSSTQQMFGALYNSVNGQVSRYVNTTDSPSVWLLISASECPINPSEWSKTSCCVAGLTLVITYFKLTKYAPWLSVCGDLTAVRFKTSMKNTFELKDVHKNRYITSWCKKSKSHTQEMSSVYFTHSEHEF